MSFSRNAAQSLSPVNGLITFRPWLRDAAPAPRAAALAAQREAARAGFAESMEFGLTALVFAAVFLFGAALLHVGAPACQARRVAVFALYGIAGGFFAAMLVMVGRGLAQLGRSARV